MPYASSKDKAIADLLHKIIITVDDIQKYPNLFPDEAKQKFGDEIFFARKVGRYQALILNVIGELRQGKTSEDITAKDINADE